MPETNDPTAPVTSHETVVNTQLTTETLDQNGKNLPANTNLASIFDRIEAGADRKEAIREVMGKKKAAAAPEKKEVVTKTEGETEKVAKEIKVTSSHPEDEKPADPAPGLNEALTRGQEKKFDDAEKANEPAPADDEPVADDQLQVLQTDKPKTAKRISALLKKVTEVTEREANTVKEKLAKDEEIKTLKDQLANVKTVDPKTEEEIVNARKELAMFRRRYDLDRDPEIKHFLT